jgi:ATP-binding cassette, subfamily B, bacterial CvaB/MchF/RaxB
MSPLSFSRRRQLPLILASEAAECGLACIAMIARYHGHDVDLNGLRQRFALSLSGMSLRSLMGLADQLGLSSRPLRVELPPCRGCACRRSCTGTSITSWCCARSTAAPR